MARYLAHVTLDGTLRPVDPERLKRLAGHDVWFSIHEQPSVGLRSLDANRWYRGVALRTFCEETEVILRAFIGASKGRLSGLAF